MLPPRPAPAERFWLAGFVVLALLLAFAYAILNPPFEAADESSHFYRAALVADGQFLSTRRPERPRGVGGELPISLIHTEQRWDTSMRGHPERPVPAGKWRVVWEFGPLEPEKRFFMEVVNTASYSPFCYPGAAAAVRIAWWCEARPLQLFYAARFGNALAWVGLVGLALWLVPVGRWLLALCALTPMSIYQAASASADSWNQGWLLLTLAVVLRVALAHSTTIARGEVFAVLGMLAGAGFLRQTFVAFALLAFLVPRSRFVSRAGQWGFYAAALAAALVPALVWTALNQSLVVWVRAELQPADQLQFLLAHPFHVLARIPATFATLGSGWASAFIGCFGWLDTPLPGWLVAASFFALALALLPRSLTEPALPRAARGVLVAAFAGSVVLLLTALFLAWTPPASTVIEGVQGRYFTPFAPLLALAIAPRRFIVPENLQAASTLVVGGAVNLVALAVLSARFWGW